MNPLKLLVTGCEGRMGKSVIACADPDPEVFVARQIDISDSLLAALPECDVVIDFSYHGFTKELVRACTELEKRLVIGTTGHTSDELEAIRDGASRIPIVFAPNFSIGVNTLFWLTQKAAQILGEDYDAEIVEMHHRMKKDAPSGTAKRLAEILVETRSLDYAEHTRHGREGDVGARTAKEIGVHALRGGDVVGDHTVCFANVGERIELTHRASSRDTFANGSIRAAKWLRDRPPGQYDMMDVLGLRD